MRRLFSSSVLPALLLTCLAFATAVAQVGPLPAMQDKAEEIVPVIQLPNNPVSDVLSYYERFTGRTLVRDANLAGPNLNIISTQPMPKSQAIRLIEAALLLNGYAIIPDSENRAKVININGGKNPRSEGTPLYANAASLPPGDRVVSYFMPLRFLSSQDAFVIFQGQIAQHPYGSIVQVPNAQALVITENLPTIRQLVSLQELIDVPPARVVSEFVTLQRADAERVADTITKLVEGRRSDKTKTGGSAQIPNTPQNPNGAPAPAIAGAAMGTLYENDLVAGSVQLVPDTRTNRILVITRPSNFPYIKGLIEDFDRAVGTNAPLERPLKYAIADEVLPVLADLLAENDSNKTGQPNTGAQTQNNQQRQSRQNQNSQRANNGANGTNGSDSSSSINSQPDVLSSPEDLGPTSMIVGKTRLIADNKANSILVIGPPESQDKVRMLLDKLDKRPAQVYLSTVIGQLKLTNDLNFGVDYLKLFQSGGTATTTTTNGTTTTTGSTASDSSGVAGTVVNNAVTSLLNPATLTTSSVFPAASGLALYGTINKSISVYVQALEKTNRFKILSSPVVYTANNKRAVISSGQRIPYAGSTLSNLNTTTNTSSTAAVSSTTEYKDVELKLEVIPLINSNNEVNLQIVQQNNTVAGNVTISGNSVPSIATQLINTTVTVPNGGTVALGGLITESTTNDLSGIPVLMHLPWIGPAFRTTTKNKERNELIILIQPTVVHTNQDILDASVKEADRTRVGDAAYDFAERTQPEPASTPTPTPPPATTKKGDAKTGNTRPK